MKAAVKYVRKSLGMTQEKFAEAIGECTKSAVANYEKGFRSPRPSITYRILELANSNGIQKIKFEDFYPRGNH